MNLLEYIYLFECKSPICIFNNPDYENISAITYTSTLSVGKLSDLSISKGDFSQNDVYSLYIDYISPPSYKLNIVSSNSPELLSDGIFIFHNPNAKTSYHFNTLKTVALHNLTLKKMEAYTTKIHNT